jgi:hypothetical protein
MKIHPFLAEGSYCGFIELMVWFGLLMILVPLLVFCMICALFPKGYRLAEKLSTPLVIFSAVPVALGIYVSILCPDESGWFMFIIPLGLGAIAWLIRVWTRQCLGRRRHKRAADTAH